MNYSDKFFVIDTSAVVILGQPPPPLSLPGSEEFLPVVLCNG